MGLRILIRGKVQGVFFRDFVKRSADALGLTGWVRNVSDGSVEVFAEGERSKLLDLLEKCKRGPQFAVVEAIETEWFEAKKKDKGFKIIY
ncbi:MAG: acylphosphatase [Candidatus Woesearchaeota archaeon]